ncbi:MAG TPA: hypothetical protein VGS61_08215, partial [Acidimicrobiales bacterium]|nr:hypothetical protein [Acidimicrobiales bacterium]
MSVVHCRRCGEILNANANFCWACGAPTVAAGSTETIAVPVVAAQEGLTPSVNRSPRGAHGDELVIASGPEAGTHIELAKETNSAGRHESSDLLLDDVSVSR